MRQATLISYLLVALLLPSLLFAASTTSALSTRILTASPTQSVVAAEFDAQALVTTLGTREFGAQPTDGYGLTLAIAGQGTPELRVTRFELGEPLTMSLAAGLAAQDVAASAEELATVSEPAILHDLRIVSIGFRPLMFADGAVRLVKNVELAVTTRGAGGVNSQADPQSFSSAFYPVYKASVANLDEMYPHVSLRAPGRYLVVTKQAVFTELETTVAWQRWLDLKKRKGYQMQIVALATPTAGNILSTIQNAYDDASQRDLEYVMILGDHGDIQGRVLPNPEHPTETPFPVGDNAYFRLDGTDMLPDVFSGRVSGVSTSDYVTYFAKVWRYETAPYTADMNWYRSATCMAGNWNDGTTGIFPVTPVWNMIWARERLMRDGLIANADTFYYHDQGDGAPGDFTTNIRADIDSGVCLFFYRGWADQRGLQYPALRVEDIIGPFGYLNNGERTPAVFSIVCGSAAFHYGSGQCFGEVFTTGMGSFNESKGAIIYFGATDLHTNTRHNNAILAGIINALTIDGIRSAGALAMAGKLEGWRQFPREQGGENSLAYYYVLHVFNLLGDPETQIYAGTPRSFTDIAVHSNLTVGQSQAPISVWSSTAPVADAVVTLRLTGSDDVAVGMTDAEGNVMLPTNFTDTATPVQITVWKAGYFQSLLTLPVESRAFDPKITAVNWTAGADNLPNPGESASFTLGVQNAGTAAYNATLAVTAVDPGLTVNTSSPTLGATDPGASATSSAIDIQFGGELHDGMEPKLSVVFTDGENSVTRLVPLRVAAPDPTVVSLAVSGDANGNAILEPGENADITATVKNVGHQDGATLTMTVGSFDAAASFSDDQSTWTSLAIGATAAAGDPFHMALSNLVTPGRQVLLRFAFSQNGVVVARKDVLLATGVVTPSVPTGPDGYGYYAYENIDGSYPKTPAYSWIELDPALGGNGTPHTVRDDYYFDMPLPRPFTFYGAEQTHVWISSNGWMSFDSMRIPEFRNWELPSPMGAPNMVCPFWEDLIGKHMAPAVDTVFTVWTLDDAAHNRFIIQWRALNREGMPGSAPGIDTAYCTFEVILEDLTSGDDDILIQYNQITQVDRGEGNYATVGIQDKYHQNGLNLTFSNFYAPSVDTLRAGRAIRFTATPPDDVTGVDQPVTPVLPTRFALHEAYPNPFNPTTMLGFDLPLAGRVSLRVYDVLGREVATLVDGLRAAGSYTVTFDGRDLATGLYFARLEAGANVQIQKLMLVK